MASYNCWAASTLRSLMKSRMDRSAARATGFQSTSTGLLVALGGNQYPHFSHNLIMGNAWFCAVQRLLHLRAKPLVVAGSLFRSVKLGDDRVKNGVHKIRLAQVVGLVSAYPKVCDGCDGCDGCEGCAGSRGMGLTLSPAKESPPWGLTRRDSIPNFSARPVIKQTG